MNEEIIFNYLAVKRFTFRFIKDRKKNANYQLGTILPLAKSRIVICNSESSLHRHRIEPGIWLPTGCVAIPVNLV